MKRTAIIAIAVILAAAIAWIAPTLSPTTRYSADDVSKRIYSVASGMGVKALSTSSTAGMGKRPNPLEDFLRKISGHRTRDQDRYHFAYDSNELDVIIDRSDDKAGLVTLQPATLPSKEAEAVHAELMKSFPKLNCRIIAP